MVFGDVLFTTHWLWQRGKMTPEVQRHFDFEENKQLQTQFQKLRKREIKSEFR